MTPEGKVKVAIKKVLEAKGAYYFMPVQMGMGKKTLDFLVCYKGKFFGIEAKAPGKGPTELQQLCMHDIRKAGGAAISIDSAELTKALGHWLDTHTNE